MLSSSIHDVTNSMSFFLLQSLNFELSVYPLSPALRLGKGDAVVIGNTLCRVVARLRTSDVVESDA